MGGTNFEARQHASSNLKHPLQLAFEKDDDSFVLEGDPIAFERDKCLAVVQALAMNDVNQEKLKGLSIKDMSEYIALALQTVTFPFLFSSTIMKCFEVILTPLFFL